MSDVKFEASQAQATVTKTNNATTDSNEQLKAIAEKISERLNSTGTAMSGQLGSVMNAAFNSDMNPIVSELQRKLNAMMESQTSTNTNLQNMADETQNLYRN